MEADRNAGRYGIDPKDYYYNKVIFNSSHGKKAWATILEPEVQQLVKLIGNKHPLLLSLEDNTVVLHVHMNKHKTP